MQALALQNPNGIPGPDSHRDVLNSFWRLAAASNLRCPQIFSERNHGPVLAPTRLPRITRRSLAIGMSLRILGFFLFCFCISRLPSDPGKWKLPLNTKRWLRATSHQLDINFLFCFCISRLPSDPGKWKLPLNTKRWLRATSHQLDIKGEWPICQTLRMLLRFDVEEHLA